MTIVDLATRETIAEVPRHESLPDQLRQLAGDIENGSVMAGQSVGMVNAEEPVAKIIDDLLAAC